MELTGKLADPTFRHERAVKAARSRTTIDAHIKALVDKAPPLTHAQRDRLASLLRGGPEPPERRTGDPASEDGGRVA